MSIQFTRYFVKGIGVGSLGLKFNFRFVFLLGIIISRVVLLVEFIPKWIFCHLLNMYMYGKKNEFYRKMNRFARGQSEIGLEVTI